MKLFSLLFLFALVASTFGLKVRDLHFDTTIISVSDEVTPDGLEHIMIQIDRIEDDVSDAGQLLSERDIRVALLFTVDQSQVFVNDVPAPFGFSELTVQAQIFEVTNGEHVPLGEVVAILIRVHVEMGSIVLESGKVVSSIRIQERVVGIETTEVWQADVLQQTFIVQEDGSTVRYEITKVRVVEGEPQLPSSEEPEKPPHHQGDHHGKPHGKPHHPNGHHGKPHDEPAETKDDDDEPNKKECAVTKKIKEFFHMSAEWFHSLSFPLRILVSFAGGIVIGLITISLMKLICGLCRSKKCCQAKQQQQQQQPVDYKANIKVYSLEYTSVPQEEKDQKDQKGSIEMV